MSSSLLISQTDGRPMYLQIMEQVRQRVAFGDWKPGDEIPSIRQLSVDLRVSVITVKRAYLELEREGVIVTQHGKGSRVAMNPKLGERVHEDELDQHLDAAVRLAKRLNLSPLELSLRLDQATRRINEEPS